MASKLLFLVFIGQILFGTSSLANTLGVEPNKVFPFSNAKTNFVKNPNCAKNVAGINNGDSLVSANNTTPLTEDGDCELDPTVGLGAVAEFLTEDLSVVAQYLKGKNCEFSFDYRNSEGPDISAVVVLGSSEITTRQLLPLSTNTQRIVLNFPCGDLSNDPKLEFSVDGSATTSTHVANIYMGEATNIGDAAQAEYLGRKTVGVGSGCNLVKNANNWDNFTDVAGCATPTFEGSVTGSDKRPNIVIPYRGAGTYRFKISATIGAEESGSGSARCGMRFSDGSVQSQTGEIYQLVSKGTGRDAQFIGEIVKTSHSSSTMTVEFQMNRFEGNQSCNVRPLSTAFAIDADYIPSTSQQVFRVGAPGIGATSYTPSFVGLGTPTNVDFTYQCVAADLIRVFGRLQTGTTTADLASISLPTNFTSATYSAGNKLIGRWWRNSSGANSNKAGSIVQLSGGTTVVLGLDEYVPASSPFNGQNGSTLFGSSEVVSFDFLAQVTASSPCPRTPMPLLKNAETNEGSGVAVNYDAYITQNAGASTCTVANQGGATWISSCSYASNRATLNIVAGKFLNASNVYCTLGPFRELRQNIRFHAKPTTSAIVLNITDENNSPLSDGGVFVSCREYR